MPALTIAEAAAHLGISQDTILKWLVDLERNGTSAQRGAEMGQAAPPVGVPDGNDLEETQAAPSAGGTDSNDLVVEILRQELEEKNRQINQLHQLLAARALSDGQKRAWWKFWTP